MSAVEGDTWPEGTAWPDGVPEAGSFVRDTRLNVDAVVMAAVGTYIQLRPIRGGAEWDAEPRHIRPLTAREELSARNTVRNLETQTRPR
jgi:hypothetical protein